MDTPYEILNVPTDASTDEIGAAFRRLSVRVHPDQGGSNSLFRSVKEAYDTLSDPRRRAEYDQLLKAPWGARPDGQDVAPGWVGGDYQPGGGWTWPGVDGRPQPHPPEPEAHTTGPGPRDWRLYAGAGAGVVPPRPATSFIALHRGATAAVAGAIATILLFVIAFSVAGPVVFIAPSLLIVLMGLVAVVAVRSGSLNGRPRRPARRRPVRRRR